MAAPGLCRVVESMPLSREPRSVAHAQRAVRTVVVVALDEPVDQHPGLGDAVEDLGVEQLAAHRAVEAFDIAVLLRAAFLDERRGHAVLG